MKKQCSHSSDAGRIRSCVAVPKVADANAPSFEPEAIAVEKDANAPVADPKLNPLELNSALLPDSKTDHSLFEAAPPSEPVSEPAPSNKTLLSGVQVCKLRRIERLPTFKIE